MGDLPHQRVTPNYPFINVGVDYAGPILMKQSNRRNASSCKVYIAIFICFSTKAIHIEIVSDLTSQAFIAAFRRFISRRGIPENVFSDNGTTFVGANNTLRELYHLIKTKEYQQKMNDAFITQGIKWHFIPPNSPHFGGLWEAGVKSKYHLRRMMGIHLFLYEELITLLNQIEAILNSRPLLPLTTDPDDLSVLTPSNFLIGRPLTALPDEDLEINKQSLLKRWQIIQRLNQQFWRKWSKEYLGSLQQRKDGQHSKPNLNINDLVLIKEDGLPPLRWQLGRVVELHPGEDETVRVATVKTKNGQFRRAVKKLCPLPKPTES